MRISFADDILKGLGRGLEGDRGFGLVEATSTLPHRTTSNRSMYTILLPVSTMAMTTLIFNLAASSPAAAATLLWEVRVILEVNLALQYNQASLFSSHTSPVFPLRCGGVRDLGGGPKR
jgi:hypothetical protein